MNDDYNAQYRFCFVVVVVADIIARCIQKPANGYE